jgi:signal transduction histidine kinase
VNRLWRSLRVRFAVLGFLASYLPVLLLFGVLLVTDTETNVAGTGTDRVVTTSDHRSVVVTWTIVALAPAAAAVAWWWAGRAVRPVRDAHERLAEAARTQARFVEELSHELRVPLSVLTNNAEVLLAHPAPTVEVYREGLARSGRAADRIRTTIDELLVDARGRARTIDRRPADLVTIVHEVAEDASTAATAKRMRLTVDAPPAAVCPVDEPTVRRAVANLVDNAIRYAPAGTAVDITVATGESHVSVVVTDEGPGIPPGEREHIFERFWRARHDQPGTGLGLPIARQIALAHGGSLTVTSRAPKGSAFRLDLRR